MLNILCSQQFPKGFAFTGALVLWHCSAMDNQPPYKSVALYFYCCTTREMENIMRAPFLTLLFVEKSYFSLDLLFFGSTWPPGWECEHSTDLGILFVYYNNNISKGFINDRFNTWKDAPSESFLISFGKLTTHNSGPVTTMRFGEGGGGVQSAYFNVAQTTAAGGRYIMMWM